MNDNTDLKKEYNRLNDTKKYEIIINRLKERGVEIIDIAKDYL